MTCVGPQEALGIFDALAPVDVAFMLGAWKGSGFPTGHPLDGVLEACHWHGKRLDSAESCHPLVFDTPRGRQVHVHPRWLAAGIPLALRWNFLKTRAGGRLVQWLLPLLATQRSRARLRLASYRGRPTATLVYDDIPVIDAFHRVDPDTVLGLMDLKGLREPFFFVLRRERG